MSGGKPVLKNGEEQPWLHGQDLKGMPREEFERIYNDPEELLKHAGEMHNVFSSPNPITKAPAYHEKSDLRRRAKNWIENRENSVAAPRTDTERNFQQATAERAQEVLKKKYGVDISVADIQAALWFHEKELLGKFGGTNEKAKPADYGDAATKAVDLHKSGKLYMSMDAINKIDADKKRVEKEAAKAAAKAEKERLKAEAKAKPPEQGFAEGGDVMDDSRVKRTGEGGQESALDFIQNTPLYKQRMEDQKQPQPQAAPAPAPQTESKPMPVIAAPPPAIIRAAEPEPPAPVQQQPQAQGQTGLFHIGTNDTDPNLTVKSAQRIIDASRTMGIDPVFLLPNQSVKKPYAETSKALQKYLDDNGIQYHMPEYEPKDPAHMSHEWVNNFAKTYNNPFIAGDSNSVRLGNWGYGAKGTALVHPDSKAVLGRVGAGSKNIADELDKHLKWYQQNAPQHRSDGGEVDRRQMHHKDVTERVPQLTEGANKLAQGEIDKHEYQRLVNQHKPVHPYESVPAPATHEEMYAALQENKRDKLGQAENIPEGHPVGLRLDIPAYKDHGVWVPTIHNQSDHKTIAHGSHAMVSDATFKIPQNKALKVATGTAKSPFATIDGNFNHISHEDAIQLAAHALNHPEWTQVGMDPERHGFFYDRRTQRPVKNAAKVLQVGPLVLAHHAELGSLSDPEYHYALGGNIGHRKHFEDGGDGGEVGHRVHFPSLSAVYD
jgi:hypothetical protein